MDTAEGRTVRKAWGGFLNDHPWSQFATLTFRVESSPDYARREFLRFARRVECRAQSSVFWFYGTEYGNRTNRLHLHALLGNSGNLTERELQREWRGGFSRFLPYDPTLNASGYVAKYVTKDLADYDISPGFPARITTPLGIIAPGVGFAADGDNAVLRQKPHRPRRQSSRH